MTVPMSTGERFIPGSTSARIAQDHLARYEFAKTFVRGKRVLDIACGTGYGSAICVEAGAHSVDGVDASCEAIAYAKRQYMRPSLQFFVGDIATFRTSSRYDVVVCFETIEHVAKYDEALATLHHALDRSGTLLISSPNREVTSPTATSIFEQPQNRFHTQEWTVGELVQLLDRHRFDVAADAVYGQRQELSIANPLLRRIYRHWCQPRYTSSPKVRPLSARTPRYVVVAATRKQALA